VSETQHILASLRRATGELHQSLEQRLDALSHLSDAPRRDALVRRYAALHGPAEQALEPFLADLPDLEFNSRRRAPFLPQGGPYLDFPQPATTAEALGMLYVLEGSTLGGRFILKSLAKGGADTSALKFLDPYGEETGRKWRAFLAVIERETAGDPILVDEACTGAVAAFRHAETVLCGPSA
jgi:heme oxygenase